MASAATIPTDPTEDLRRWKTPALVFAAAVLAGHAPLAALHLQSLWQREQYQYFPFVMGAIVWLLWSRWQAADATAAVGRWTHRLGWSCAAAALVMLAGSILIVSPWFAFVSLNLGLAAVFSLLSRQRTISYLWGIWLLLWLLVPPPLGTDDWLVTSLQRLSSQLSSTILDLLGIMHLMSGNVLQLPSKEFFVDEACSGIISVMSMIACGTVYAVWRRRSFAHLVALVLMGVTWALVLNVLRICLIAGVYQFFAVDLSSGAVHEVLGLALFLLMFLALISTDYLLVMMMAPIDADLLGEAGRKNRLVQLWNRSGAGEVKLAAELTADIALAAADRGTPSPRMSTAVAWAVPFLILGLVQLVWLPSSDTAEAAQSMAQAMALDEQSLPAQIGPWIRQSFESVEREALNDFGKYSRTYRYRHHSKSNVTATVSLDFPYLGGWHDLCMCYRNSGWTIRDRVVESDTGTPGSETPGTETRSGSDWKYVVGDLTDPALGSAYISFAGFDASGEIAEPPGDAVLFRPWFRLRRRLLRNLAPQLFQVQVFASGSASEDLDSRRELRQLLAAARDDFRDRVAVNQAE